jgi:hypothetical protein
MRNFDQSDTLPEFDLELFIFFHCGVELARWPTGWWKLITDPWKKVLYCWGSAKVGVLYIIL